MTTSENFPTAWRIERAAVIRERMRASIEPYRDTRPTGWAFDAIREATDAFLDALAEWIATGSDDDRLATQAASSELLASWRTAAADARADRISGGRPETRSTAGLPGHGATK